MNKILENLATHGLGKPNVIYDYKDCQTGTIDDFRIIDVRTLDSASEPSEYESLFLFVFF